MAIADSTPPSVSKLCSCTSRELSTLVQVSTAAIRQSAIGITNSHRQLNQSTIAAEKNIAAIRELVDVLNGKDKALKSDALKVLYEVGYRAPELIAPFIAQFKNLLANPDNRLVWGAMCAIDGIATIKPDAVFMILPQIMAAVDRGTVITRDHAVKTLAKLAAQERFARTAMPLLLEQLRTAPVNQFPMYAELVAAIVFPQDVNNMRQILEARLPELPNEAKKKRVEKALRRLRAA